MRAGFLDRVLNAVNATGHIAEVVLLLAIRVRANLVQVLVGVIGVVRLVVGLSVVAGVVGAPGVAGQESHQLTRVRLLGALAVIHQTGEVHDVFVAHHIVGSDVAALVLGDVEEHVRVDGVVDDQLGSEPGRAVLQRVGVATTTLFGRSGIERGDIPGGALLGLHTRGLRPGVERGDVIAVAVHGRTQSALLGVPH